MLDGSSPRSGWARARPWWCAVTPGWARPLLEYLAGRASESGCGVAHATGVQSEMELAFAGLHQLTAAATR